MHDDVGRHVGAVVVGEVLADEELVVGQAVGGEARDAAAAVVEARGDRGVCGVRVAARAVAGEREIQPLRVVAGDRGVERGEHRGVRLEVARGVDADRADELRVDDVGRPVLAKLGRVVIAGDARELA